jgi:hypothetical protein
VHSILPLWHLYKSPAQYTALQLISRILTNERWQSVALADLQLLAQVCRQPDTPPTVLHHPQVKSGLAHTGACLLLVAITRVDHCRGTMLAVSRGTWTCTADRVYGGMSSNAPQ